jgi:peptide/nickel transport system permease protein
VAQGAWRHRTLTFAATALTLIIVAALAAPWIAPHQPTEFLAVGPFQTPSSQAWLGTDQIGRDLLSRLLFGARTSLLIAGAATLIGVGGGFVVGLASGYFGGWFDLIVQRLLDVLDAFPALVLAILLVALLGASAVNVTIAIGVVLIPGANRVARSITLGQRSLAYVEAAEAIGATPLRLMVRHVAPGLVAPLLIVAASALSGTIVAEASLSFLGLGAPPPTPTWGQMLSGDVRQYFVTEPWLAVVPGAALTFTVLCASLVGDGLRDLMDPRLRRR